jgi:hypothetical protein
MENLKQPLTNTQEILITLIKKGHVSIFDFSYLSGYRTRVSELIAKYNLTLKRTTDTRCNKFGNSYSYAIYFLEPENKNDAIMLYKKLTDFNK